MYQILNKCQLKDILNINLLLQSQCEILQDLSNLFIIFINHWVAVCRYFFYVHISIEKSV